MRRLVAPLLAAFAVVLAACSAPPSPEVTFYTDGESIRAAPLSYCDALLTSCAAEGEPVTLQARPGKPVQVSLPSEIADTPWVLNVQYFDAAGEAQIRQEVFTDGTQSAYTVAPEPHDQLLVVEVQQFGAAYAADEQGDPITDERGEPQLVMRGVWSLQIEPAPADA